MNFFILSFQWILEKVYKWLFHSLFPVDFGKGLQMIISLTSHPAMERCKYLQQRTFFHPTISKNVRIGKICTANWSESGKSGKSNWANQIHLYCELSESSKSSENTSKRINIRPIHVNWTNIDSYIHNTYSSNSLSESIRFAQRITSLLSESRICLIREAKY